MLKNIDDHHRRCSSRQKSRSRSRSRTSHHDQHDDRKGRSRRRSRERSSHKKSNSPTDEKHRRNRNSDSRSEVTCRSRNQERSNDRRRRGDSSGTRKEHRQHHYDDRSSSRRRTSYLDETDKKKKKCYQGNTSDGRDHKHRDREYFKDNNCGKHLGVREHSEPTNCRKESTEIASRRCHFNRKYDKHVVSNENRNSLNYNNGASERLDVRLSSHLLTTNNEGSIPQNFHSKRRTQPPMKNLLDGRKRDDPKPSYQIANTVTQSNGKRLCIQDIDNDAAIKERHRSLNKSASPIKGTIETRKKIITGFERRFPRKSSPSYSYASTATPNSPNLGSLSCREVPLDDGLDDNSTTNESDEKSWVGKWIRSAPDELYYNRGAEGSSNATERTKALCNKFTKSLLDRATRAREEAEMLGREQMAKMKVEKEVVVAETKKLWRKVGKGDKVKCCDHDHSSKQYFTGGPPHSSIVDSASKVQSMKGGSTPSQTGALLGESVLELVHNDNLEQSDNDTWLETVAKEGEEVLLESTTFSPSFATDSIQKGQNQRDDYCTGCGEGSDDKVKEMESLSLASCQRNDETSSFLDIAHPVRHHGYEELQMKRQHPRRLHPELWHNDPETLNDGPVCRCSPKARRSGIRHGVYPGEERPPRCDPFSNNKDRLFHYRVTVSPADNFLVGTPTVINHDGHEYIFEGFSLFSHHRFNLSWPSCKMFRFNTQYDVFLEEERFPESFCLEELNLFEKYLFREILELGDLDKMGGEGGCCPKFHLMPRFLRLLPDNGKEILSMSRVLLHLLKNGANELIREEDLQTLFTVEQSEWQDFADRYKGSIVTRWGMKPCALRVDQIDRDVSDQEGVFQEEGIPFPLLVHFGNRPPQLSYAGCKDYQRDWARYVKYRHLLANMPKPSSKDKFKLYQMRLDLQTYRNAAHLKKGVTIVTPIKGFQTTGICCDLTQHALLIPVLDAHLRFHCCLETLEQKLEYKFKNRQYLQLALTHPSYRENFGTNADHVRNSLTNCGIRHPKLGQLHTNKKKGINTLIHIMAKFASDQETESGVGHNERLEFLGDTIIELLTTVHLFHIFPDLEEGGLATYRTALVQNQHLTILGQGLNLQDYMLYAHTDLCHELDLNHALANCFEALMGALYLDGGIEAADRVLGRCLYGNEPHLYHKWTNYPPHPLQQEEPEGDRHWIKTHQILENLVQFENNIGVEFKHIRLLARAFTDQSLEYNHLTKGSNQRMEFLGDSVLQLIVSDYLYRHFPEHHEGHLSLLRSSLVSNRALSEICQDLGLSQYSLRATTANPEFSIKDKADLFEAFFGALYLDKGLKYCECLSRVCVLPRLNTSIITQAWNDPKSKLQQCCITLRPLEAGVNEESRDHPVYRVIEAQGASNSRVFVVAVYFRNQRLATGKGSSIHAAEMAAATAALKENQHLFPHLKYQKRVVRQTVRKRNDREPTAANDIQADGMYK